MSTKYPFEKVDCGSCTRCCEYVWLPIGIQISDDYKKYLEYHDIKVVKANGQYQALIKNTCNKLSKDGCTIHKDRPEVCKQYICKEKYDEYQSNNSLP